MILARRRVLQALAWVAASLSARGGAALESTRSRIASSPAPASAASSAHGRGVTMPPPPPPPPKMQPQSSTLLGARGFLIAGHDEAPGFGAYGYLLLLAPPRDDERARHLTVLAAWLRQFPTVDEFLSNRVQPREISLVQLPVRYEPQLSVRPQAASDAVLLGAAQQLLEAYDHARAQTLATRLSLHIAGSGPVLVTVASPARAGSAVPAVVENMSGVSPEVAEAWLRAAMLDALEPRRWSAGSLVRLALRMRNVVAHLATTLSQPGLRADERVQLAQLASR